VDTTVLIFQWRTVFLFFLTLIICGLRVMHRHFGLLLHVIDLFYHVRFVIFITTMAITFCLAKPLNFWIDVLFLIVLHSIIYYCILNSWFYTYWWRPSVIYLWYLSFCCFHTEIYYYVIKYIQISIKTPVCSFVGLIFSTFLLNLYEL